ncbi:alpha/beta fold hydrolase [Bacillus niameyensis]|uniref:alpha/beta fold hydrolase n=1 Tax=Bacillus niameyensis TaxID=1522308 RepID=UPI001E454ADA|nr:alpha/beta hydrolase [Bacillus niameyensis]
MDWRQDMFIKEAGDETGPLLIFLHGGGVSGWMWDKQLEYFQDYQMLVPDLPGHGKSSSESHFSIKNSAEEIIRKIKLKAHGKQVIIIGFSLGAQIIIEILHQEPDLIDYAVINSALVRPMPLFHSFISPMVKSTAFLIKNRTFARLQARELYIDNENFDTYFLESKQMKAETLIQVLKENMVYTIPKNFSKAKTEILVTVGEKEKGMMRKSAQDLIKANPNCKGIIFPKVGHGISFADPKLFNKTIDAWLNERKLPENMQIISN